ncbi:unnamed protein product [Amoebophrya sp. A25]|nr:unnamed protein product [Amoebophrya sp. A25]|eukprot:GSA25T00010915001.1
MAAVLEYLVAEMCESAGDRAKRGKAENGPKRSRITPRIIQLTIREDPEFNSLLQRVTVAGGGVLPLSDESIKKMVHARTAQAMETKQNIAAAQEGITPGAEMTPGEEPIYAGDVTPGGDLTPAEEA